MPLIEGCRNAPGLRGGGIIHKIRGEDLVAVRCPNMAAIRLKQRLASVHSQLPTAKHDATTPLFQRGRVDRTRDNIFFGTTLWQTFLGHLKWIVASKDIFVRVVTDKTLVNVYVGNTSIKSRLKEQLQNDDEPLLVSACLEDLLSGPDLVVISLGYVVNFNKAAANILHEGLLLRAGLGKATWIVEPPSKPFTPWKRTDYGIPTGMPCCDDDVLAFVNARFDRVHLPARDGEREVGGAYVEDDGADEVTIEGPSELGEMLPDDSPEEDAAPLSRADDDLIQSLQGPQRSKFHTSRKSPWKGGHR